jgi:hypothetical protein
MDAHRGPAQPWLPGQRVHDPLRAAFRRLPYRQSTPRRGLRDLCQPLFSISYIPRQLHEVSIGNGWLRRSDLFGGVIVCCEAATLPPVNTLAAVLVKFAWSSSGASGGMPSWITWPPLQGPQVQRVALLQREPSTPFDC